MRKKILIYVTTIVISLNSCNESPSIDFQSYHELAGYDFIGNGWFPEILQHDAYKIQETYDINSKHLYGKFDFKNRLKLDSILRTYSPINMDSLRSKMDNIDKPECPDWFLTKEDIIKDSFIMAKHHDFYLILGKRTNKIYFLR